MFLYCVAIDSSQENIQVMKHFFSRTTFRNPHKEYVKFPYRFSVQTAQTILLSRQEKNIYTLFDRENCILR